MEDIERLLRAAMEQAAIAGLCRDGQIEFAVGDVARQLPALDKERLLQLAAGLTLQPPDRRDDGCR